MHAMIGLALAAFAPQEKPPAPAPSAFVEPQDLDRPALSAADLKSLRENNIFSPYKPGRKLPPIVHTKPPERPTEKPRPKPPVLTGIILDTASKSYQAVVEDRNVEKLRLLPEPRFMKAGDTVLVYTIDSVETEKVVVRWGESKKDLKVGDAFPDAGIKAPEAADLPSQESTDGTPPETKTETKKSDSSTTVQPSLDEASRKKILEELMKKQGKKRRTDEEP